MLVILGNQLFSTDHLPPPESMPVFMAEDLGLCTYEKHHQQKIVLFLAAMRAYADELQSAGYEVHYLKLEIGDSRSYEEKLAQVMEAVDDDRLQHFEIEDKAFEQRLVRFAENREIARKELKTPMFTCSREAFRDYVAENSSLVMGDFYKWQRRRLGLLVDDDGEPRGGRWSFDADNRKRLPASVVPPEVRWPEADRHVADVIEVVEQAFSDHPGMAREFRWPTTRRQALDWLDDFIAQRLAQFGPYEDAITTRSDSVFHSMLSPYLNMGLLAPLEVIERVEACADEVALQSLEGFIRQVLGWREFVRGVYREFGETQAAGNFWSHTREPADSWYDGSTGIPPLDDTVRTIQRLGWAHHIPRLMILGNLMTLCEIRPTSAHRWFMEMFIDSSEWVMGPNVYGMALYSDGGTFATKPYICGSNYLLKMSDYSKGPWCDTVDGLYWRFIDKHRAFFAGNPRLAMMPKLLDRLESGRRERIFSAAEGFIAEHTGNAS